jgi:hypothetical protein
MSVKVDLDQLADALADFALAYLITVGDDYRAHTVAVEPTYAEGILDIGPMGRHTRDNVAAHKDVTLIWPPRDAGGYTLIVDGIATSDGDELTVVPGRAVLHRRATAQSPSKSPNPLHDCVPLEG